MLDENKPMTLKDIYLKYFKNTAILLLIWSAGYAAFYNLALPILKGEPISLSSFISALINGHYQMWYMYLLLGIYLALPFLRVLVKRENKDLVLALIIIMVIIQGVYPWLQELSKYYKPLLFICAFIQKFYLQYFMGFTVYYLIGWYVFNIGIKNKNTKILLCIGGVVSLLVNILYITLTDSRNISHSPLNIFSIIYSTAIFIALSKVNYNWHSVSTYCLAP